MICRQLQIPVKEIDLTNWEKLIDNMKNPDKEVNISVCGKYVEHRDAYKSVEAALIHSAAAHKARLKINWVDSEKSNTPEKIKEALKETDGILIPGGFGIRGINGKINIAKFARENNIPFFGICLGMQVAVIEFAKNVCNLPDAYSTEFDEHCKDPIISLLEDQQDLELMGGTMRLGAWPCDLQANTMAAEIYGEEHISERHRHRYEVNNDYRECLTSNGMVLSGTSMKNILCEIVEIPSHPFYIGVQFHPEFKSRPMEPHPVFKAFVGAAVKKKSK